MYITFKNHRSNIYYITYLVVSRKVLLSDSVFIKSVFKILLIHSLCYMVFYLYVCPRKLFSVLACEEKLGNYPVQFALCAVG